MKYKLDDPVPVQEINEISGAEILEEINNDITPRIELLPEFAHQIEIATKEAVVRAIGAFLDACLIYDIDPETASQITFKGIELLKLRKVCDLTKGY
jgi:hypothetical protein